MLTRSRSRSTEVDAEPPQSQDSGIASQSQSSSVGDSAPQEKHVPKKKKGRSLNRKQPAHMAQWVCLLPEDPDEQFNSSFIILKDPKTACARRYLLRRCRESSDVRVNCELFEVMKMEDGPRSWFIDNTIQTDGSLHICTRIDPLFLALPYLLEAAKLGKFTTMDTILEDQTTHSSRVLEECVAVDQWEHVTDSKELSSGLKVYKYSREKTQSWLRAKVEALGSGLEEEGVFVGAGSISSSLVRSSRQPTISKDDYLRYACGVVSDYLPSELADELAKCYPSPLESAQVTPNHKREAEGSIEANGAPPAKKGRPAASDGEPLEDYTKLSNETAKPKQVTQLTSSQKALAKVDKTGMKSISSFFSPKLNKRNNS